MSNTTQYVRKCKDCSQDILMKNLGGKWAALEKDGSTQHRCKTQPENTHNQLDATKKEDEMITTLTQRITTMEQEIIELKKRVASIESWINKVSESWVMNQL